MMIDAYRSHALLALTVRRTFTIPWLLGVAIFMGGCRKEPASPPGLDASEHSQRQHDRPQVTQPERSSNKTGAPATTSHAPTSIAKPANETTPLLFPASQVTAGDPAAEGWQGEAFSELANAQLKHLIHWIIEPTSEDPEQLFSPSFRTSTITLPLVTAYEDGAVRVERSADASAIPALHATTPDAAFASLRSLIASARQRHGKFKLFRVSEDAGEIVTQQFFHLDAKADDSAVEHNSTWSIRWDTSDSQRPRIAEVRVVDTERVTTYATTEGRFSLLDCTASVLQHNEAYERCLVPGIPQWHTRVEKTRGVYHNGQHGLAIGDANGDGLDDLYICQTGGLPNHLFLQSNDGRLHDHSNDSGTNFLDNSRSALFVDLDNDGDQDLVVALSSGVVMLENDGRGKFLGRARISSLRQAFSLAAVDYDGDTLLDVYICVYYGSGQEVSELPLPLPYFDAKNGGRNHLVRNQGGWKFEDATERVGLDVDNHRFSFAASWEDEDNDGDLDLYVVNDFGPNQLFRNERGTFVDRTKQAGLVDGAFGMSATFGDFDRDGNFDIYVSNMFSAAGNRITFDPRFKSNESAETIDRFRYLARGNSLFQNQGDGRYQDVSLQAGVTMGRWSWASLFCDLNNDAWDDLLVANGYLTGEQTDDL